jgi:glycosyltransferase involved in cell wall biosynthesis
VRHPRKVGFNALFLDPGVSGGSETYLRALVPALVEAHPDVQFEIATTRRGAKALSEEPWADLVALLRLPCDDDEPARRTVVEQIVLPRLARRRGWDVLHSLANRGPARTAQRSVVTVLDVIFFHQRTMGRVSTHGMRWAVRGAIAGADAVIAISEAAAHDIATTLGVDRARITAIPLGAGREPFASANLSIRRRLGLEQVRVVLCVAAKRPHKNQGLLIATLPELPADLHAVLVGHDEGYGAELRATARNLGVADRVHLVDYLPDEQLEGLWASAGCACFPTRAEGFGLPVLEAMRRGVPVACSDIPVLREVAGDAAHYFDPSNPKAAASAINEAMRDEAAAARGKERSAGFTWERTASETFSVYRGVVGGR